MEDIDYSILYRWFVGLNLDEKVWDATTFTKNRDRLLEGSVAKEFLAQVVDRALEVGLVSDEHFSVDGTLLEAWASLKSFQPKEQKAAAPPDDPVTRVCIFTARSGPTKPMSRKPIRMRSWRARGPARRPS